MVCHNFVFIQFNDLIVFYSTLTNLKTLNWSLFCKKQEEIAVYVIFVPTRL